MAPINDEFENALAWFAAAPAQWLASGKKNIAACAEWVWEVLQGDFNDDQTKAQMVTGTVISMIPLVDQLCDARDVVANCKKINREPGEKWHWVALVLTLIGLFPSLGSLVKGCGKVMFASLRKAGYVSGATPQVARAIESAIAQLNKFLARPEVIKTLAVLKIDNPYKYLSKQVRSIAARLSTSALLAAFDAARDAVRGLLELVQKWGGTTLAVEATNLLKMIDGVRRNADKMLGQAIKPVQDILERLARRLDIESDMAHRAHLQTVNPHAFVKPSSAAEQELMEESLPKWADATDVLVHPPAKGAPDAMPGWTSLANDPTRVKHPLNNAYQTFNTIEAVTLPPGTRLYRVVDPTSSDNSICWMREAEFLKLTSKDDWRRRFAVWVNWNSNGEYVTYVVPPGGGLHVWEGVTASQRMKNTPFVLEGGGIQIVVNPADLEKVHLSPRKLTNWADAYSDFGTRPSLVGVPTLTNNWYEKQ